MLFVRSRLLAVTAISQNYFMTGTASSVSIWSDPGFIMLAVLSLIILLAILYQVMRLSRYQLNRKEKQEDLVDLIERLNQTGQQQSAQLRRELLERVSDANREQREINALFMKQLQQSNQGSGHMLDSIRQSIQSQMGKIAVNLKEMQQVARDVRSLRQVLGSVRGRGVVGELQLEQLLSDVLAPTQYQKQVRIRKDRQETVDVAIKLGSEAAGTDIMLPIDAKFPLDYLQRLLGAREADDTEAEAVFSRELIRRVRQEARKISSLYIVPPQTTDFAVLYLPGETLFAEVMRDGELAADLYRQYQVILAGPTSMTSLLAGLQAVFRLQTMEQKSWEIARSLAAVQHDFRAYEDILEKVHARLSRALSETENCLSQARQVRRRLDDFNLGTWTGTSPEDEKKQVSEADHENEPD
jgi:DNA recombination protein RmuC